MVSAKTPNNRLGKIGLVALAVCLLCLLLPVVASARTQTYVIIGKWVEGSSVFCPDPDTAVCALVRMMLDDNYHLIVESVEPDSYGHHLFDVWLNTPWPEDSTRVQGKDLDYQRIVPIE
jgi:hypothetical protein